MSLLCVKFSYLHVLGYQVNGNSVLSSPRNDHICVFLCREAELLNVTIDCRSSDMVATITTNKDAIGHPNSCVVDVDGDIEFSMTGQDLILYKSFKTTSAC